MWSRSFCKFFCFQDILAITKNRFLSLTYMCILLFLQINKLLELSHDDMVAVCICETKRIEIYVIGRSNQRSVSPLQPNKWMQVIRFWSKWRIFFCTILVELVNINAVLGDNDYLYKHCSVQLLWVKIKPWSYILMFKCYSSSLRAL